MVKVKGKLGSKIQNDKELFYTVIDSLYELQQKKFSQSKVIQIPEFKGAFEEYIFCQANKMDSFLLSLEELFLW